MTTPSPIFGLPLQDTGENINSWGDVLNLLFQLVEQAIGGVETIALTGDISLTNDDLVENQSRKAIFKLSGDGEFTITSPAGKPRKHLVKNDCTGAVTFTHGSGATITVPAGKIKWIATDGTDFFTAEEEDYLLLAGGTVSGLIKYHADYSESEDFDDRSLVDRAFANTKLSKAGGTMTDFIVLHADATDDMHPVTWQQLQAVALGSVSISFAWGDITGKPTTRDGYGLTDVSTTAEINAALATRDEAINTKLTDNLITKWRLRP